MPTANEQYLFAAIRVPNKITDALAAIQRNLSQALKTAQSQHKLLPRRMFLVPVFDLKKIPECADEAVVLSFERERDAISDHQLSVERIAYWPDEDAPEQIVAVLKDHDDRIGSLRDQVSHQLKRFGFEVQTGNWRPVIPLIRLQADAQRPPIETDLSAHSFMPWPARSVSLFGRASQQREKFQLRSKINLSTESSKLTPGEEDSGAAIAAIAKELHDRIEQRRLRLSETKRTERNRTLRMEETSMEPTPNKPEPNTDDE